ncbi:MAG TPA: hypothetical protein VEU33_02925, partial [Archangium sp.]|nr:hypothetical protein [Archangium sp.]
MMKSRVPPRGGGAVERGARSFLLALVALVLLGLAPGAPPMARDALRLDEAARCGPGPGPVRDMVTWERLCRATMRAAAGLPDSDARRLVSRVGPRHLSTLHTLTSLWLGPRGKPVVEDVVARAWPSLPGRPGPEQLQRVSHALWRYVNEATFARTQEELGQAALALGEAVAAGGVDAVVLLLEEGLLSSQARLRDAPREEPLVVVPASARAEHREDTPEPGGCATPPPGWPAVTSGAVRGLVAPDS